MKNSALNNARDDYYTQEKDFLLHLIPDGPNVVLDVGCGSGRVGKRLLELGKAATVIGIEIFESAANEASEYYGAVHIGNVEKMDLPYEHYFDVIICGDIIEHLQEPFKVLETLHGYLKDDGLIVCCVPNVRYWRIWKTLVFQGNWEYAAQGIMDQTHLRFFTARSFKKLLASASYQVQDEEMRIAKGPRQKYFNQITRGVFREFLGIQMMITARKRGACRTPRIVPLRDLK